jgi:hypothetical protein
MAFPTLSKPPGYPLPVERIDNLIESPPESGLVITRNRFPRQRRKWSPRFENLTQADHNLIEAHANTVGCSGIFTWAHPVSGQYNVRYEKGSPKYQVVGYDGGYLYGYEMTFLEV